MRRPLAYDYVSPGLTVPILDAFFPNMAAGDEKLIPWKFLRRGHAHRIYIDRRNPDVGFINRDEVSVLYNNALQFKGKRGVEIGAWRGWSAAHILRAGVELDIVDPLLQDPNWKREFIETLSSAGSMHLANLHPGSSPQLVEVLGQAGHRWAIAFIDGDHEGEAPRGDARAVMQYLEADALVLFHDLFSIDVARGLDAFRDAGWNTMIYQTAQMMGVAWRGAAMPVHHRPDLRQGFRVPDHLEGYRISGDQPQIKTLQRWLRRSARRGARSS